MRQFLDELDPYAVGLAIVLLTINGLVILAART